MLPRMNDLNPITLRYEPPQVEVLGTLVELTAGAQAQPQPDETGISV
jgi:hypothetical protein